ncbi:MAG: ATP-binding protein [Puniceicoccaceae bacterium]
MESNGDKQYRHYTGGTGLLGAALDDLELLQAAMQNITSGVTVADARDPELPLVFVNTGFENITGYTAEEVLGISCRFLQGEEKDQPGLKVLREALWNKEPCVVRLRNYRKDGSLFHNELRISPVFNKAGELTHFVGIQLDVTERVRARESLEESRKQIRQALEQEAELNAIKSRFISMVSHEFRTPMTGIHSSASLIRKFSDKLGPDKVGRHWQNIETSLKRMNRLLDDVLFFSQSEADKVEVLLEPVDLSAYLTSLVDNMDHTHPGRQVKVEYELSHGKTFQLDVHLMDHIFHNLLGNALKYSAADSLVTLSVKEEDGQLEFNVKDRGIGIPERDHGMLFDAFHRAGNVGARKGTGIGLNIAKRAAELLGGNLEFSSHVGEGSTFVVKFPLREEKQ